MPIKREKLEQMWHYRAVKVALIALPFVIIILWLLSLLRGTVVSCTIVPKYDADLIRRMLAYFALALVAYFVFLSALSRVFFYLVFGGIEEKTLESTAPPTTPVKNDKMTEIIQVIIIVILLLVAWMVQSGRLVLPKIGGDDVGVNKPANGPVCHDTSAGWGVPCGSSKGGAGVSGLPIPERCGCPSDTEYSGTTDVVTPGGPYLICLCK